MIFSETPAYARVWDVTPSENGKYIDLRITTSEKDTDGNYRNSTWFPRCIGKAVNTLKGIKKGDKITIHKLKLTNESTQQEDGSYKSWLHFVIMDAEIDGEVKSTGTPTTGTTAKAAPQPKPEPPAEDDCPW